MNENSNPMEEIEKEIEETRRKASKEDFEIEIADDKEEVKAESEVEEKPQEETAEEDEEK